MTPSSAPRIRVFAIVVISALILSSWVALSVARRAEFVSAVGLEARPDDPASVTGQAGGVRELVIPVRSVASAHWIIQTQQMLASDSLVVREIGYENAPQGRSVSAAAPYRWWLAAVAWSASFVTGRSMAVSIEGVALLADPLLHAILILTTALFVLRHFGPLAGSFAAVAVGLLHPLSTAFLPGAPDSIVPTLALAIWSVLPLAAGIHMQAVGNPAGTRRARGLFALAGAVNGLGMWVDVSMQFPVVLGVALGVATAGFLAARDESRTPVVATAPWLTWAAAGVAVSLVGFFIEYSFAAITSGTLRANHPLYALAWAGAAVLATTPARWRVSPAGTSRGRVVAVAAVGALALTTLPLVMWLRGEMGFLAGDLSSLALSRFDDLAIATSSWAWLGREGISREVVFTFLPVLLLFAAVGVAWVARREPTARCASLIALGPAVVALGFALWRLEWWTVFAAMLVPVIAAATASANSQKVKVGVRVAWIATVVVVLFFSAGRTLAPAMKDRARPLDDSEFTALVQRDLAHWLAARTADIEPVVLAPPNDALALAYYGSLRGLGTLDPENEEGIRAVARILQSGTPEEGQALFSGRAITHVVIPSWDAMFDQLAGKGGAAVEGSFLDTLRKFELPPWLRPVAYEMPADAARVGWSVLVLEVVEEQGEALQLSRLADYFLELGRVDIATAIAQELRRFPADMSAWVARVQVESASGAAVSKAPSLETMLTMLENGLDRRLPIDRRVAFAMLLARAQRMDLAAEQVRQCNLQLNEQSVRSLTAGQLYGILYLGKLFGLPVADERARVLAPALLPAATREQLAGAPAR